MASVSVVIATYNGADFVCQALDSVFRQTRLPQEIVVVDDASSDRSTEVVVELARSSPVPLRLIRLKKNSGGPAHPLNVGIDAAASEIIAVLDQDDVFLPGHLARQVSILERRPELSFVFSLCGDYDHPDRTGHEVQSETIVASLRAKGQWQDNYYCLDGKAVYQMLFIHGNFIVGYPGFVFRRTSWLQKGGLDTHLRVASDYDLLRWLCQCGPVAFVPEKFFLRRTHAKNLSTGRLNKKLLLDEFAIHKRFVAHRGWLLDDDQLAPEIRERLFDKTAWFRVHGWYAQEEELFDSWLASDPQCRACVLQHLRRYSWWHCEMGNYRHAWRLLWQARRVCGWDREVLKSARAVVLHWLLNSVRLPPNWAPTLERLVWAR